MIKGVSTLTKKRFYEIESRVRTILAADGTAAGEVMRAICEVMKFDPKVSCYSEEIREKLVENNRKWRQRKREDRTAEHAPETAAARLART